MYRPIGRPFVRSQNVGWGRLLLDDLADLDEKTHATFPESEIHAGDVLLNITGASIGRSAVANERLAGGNVNQHVCEIRLDRSRLIPEFVCFFLLSRAGQDQIDSFQAGGNRQGLNFGQIRSMEIPEPEVAEQCRIAEALSDADQLMISPERLVAKKRDVKQGTMQEFARTDPAAGVRGRVDNPEDRGSCRGQGRWDTLYGGVTILGWQRALDELRRDSPKARLATRVRGRISSDGLRESAAQLLPVGTVLMALAGQGKTRGTVAVSHVELATNQSIAGVLPSGDHNPDFLYYDLDSRYEELRSESSGDGGRGGLNLTIIKNLQVPMPPLDEQTAIADVLSDMDALKLKLSRGPPGQDPRHQAGDDAGAADWSHAAAGRSRRGFREREKRRSGLRRAA